MTNELALTITAFFILSAIGLTLIRLFLGPTLFDRVLAANSISTKILILITVLSFTFQAPANILDIALLYALMTFTATIAVLKFFRDRQNRKTRRKPHA